MKNLVILNLKTVQNQITITQLYEIEQYLNKIKNSWF